MAPFVRLETSYIGHYGDIWPFVSAGPFRRPVLCQNLLDWGVLLRGIGEPKHFSLFVPVHWYGTRLFKPLNIEINWLFAF